MTTINLNEVAAEIADEKGPVTHATRQRPPSHIRRKNKTKSNRGISKDHEELNELLTPTTEEMTQESVSDVIAESDDQESLILQSTETEEMPAKAEAPVEGTAEVKAEEPVKAVPEEPVKQPETSAKDDKKFKAFADLLKEESSKGVKFKTVEQSLHFIDANNWKSVWNNFKGIFNSEAQSNSQIVFNFLGNLKDTERSVKARNHTARTLLTVLAQKVKNCGIRKTETATHYEVYDYIGRGYIEFVVDFTQEDGELCVGWTSDYQFKSAMEENKVENYSTVSIDVFIQALDCALTCQSEELADLAKA